MIFEEPRDEIEGNMKTKVESRSRLNDLIDGEGIELKTFLNFVFKSIWEGHTEDTESTKQRPLGQCRSFVNKLAIISLFMLLDSAHPSYVILGY